MEKKELAYLMALRKVKGLGNSKIIHLLNHFDRPSELIYANIEKLKRFTFMSQDTCKELQLIKNNIKEYETIFDYCISEKIEIITYFDNKYPEKLRGISFSPIILFAKGNTELLNKKSISIVGSRDISVLCAKWTFQTARELAKREYVIITGGAKGTDIHANKGALSVDGETIVVLGSGIDNPYPKENIEIFNQVIKTGLLLSEYGPFDNVNRFTLLERNRITSGLGDMMILVDADMKSGAMCQFEVALKQGKKIVCPNPRLGIKQKEGIIHLTSERRIDTINTLQDIISKVPKTRTDVTLKAYSV